MEFPFNCCQALGCDSEGFSVISSDKIRRNPSFSQISLIVDKMGEASSKAQKLKATITSTQKLIIRDEIIYFSAEGKTVIGILKTGKRKLFIRNQIGKIHEITPICVLDFYVHESVQRGGFGKKLFEKMLSYENAEPKQLAYDRPSPLLLSFLKKHYSLSYYVPQNNNFVVFAKYFEEPIKGSITPTERNKVPAGFTKQDTFSNAGRQLMAGTNYSKFGGGIGAGVNPSLYNIEPQTKSHAKLPQQTTTSHLFQQDYTYNARKRDEGKENKYSKYDFDLNKIGAQTTTARSVPPAVNQITPSTKPPFHNDLYKKKPEESKLTYEPSLQSIDDKIRETHSVISKCDEKISELLKGSDKTEEEKWNCNKKKADMYKNNIPIRTNYSRGYIAPFATYGDFTAVRKPTRFIGGKTSSSAYGSHYN